MGTLGPLLQTQGSNAYGCCEKPKSSSVLCPKPLAKIKEYFSRGQTQPLGGKGEESGTSKLVSISVWLWDNFGVQITSFCLSRIRSSSLLCRSPWKVTGQKLQRFFQVVLLFASVTSLGGQHHAVGFRGMPWSQTLDAKCYLSKVEMLLKVKSTHWALYEGVAS